MRIFISGAQRVGKTTVAKELATRLNLSYLDAKVSQAIKEQGIGKPDDHLESNDFFRQMEVQDFVSDHLNNLFSNNVDFVTDRCFLDVNAYTYYIAVKGGSPAGGKMIATYHNTYEKTFERQADLFQSDDTIVFVINPSKDFPFTPDEKSGGERSQKIVANDIVDQLYEHEACGYANMNRVFVIPDECTGVENRVQWCLAKINAIQKPV